MTMSWFRACVYRRYPQPPFKHASLGIIQYMKFCIPHDVMRKCSHILIIGGGKQQLLTEGVIQMKGIENGVCIKSTDGDWSDVIDGFWMKQRQCVVNDRKKAPSYCIIDICNKDQHVFENKSVKKLSLNTRWRSLSCVLYERHWWRTHCVYTK